MVAKATSHWEVVPILMKISKAIKHTMIVIMVHPVVTNKMDFTLMANIGLHHGEAEGNIMS